MEQADLLRDILIRITLLLACGWLILFALAARNPRWSVLLTRCLAVGCLLFPLACLSLPEIRLEVLAPVNEPATLRVSESTFNFSTDTEPLPVPESQTEASFPAPVVITLEPQQPPQNSTEIETVAAAPSLPAPNLSESKLNEQAAAEIPAVSPQAVLKEEPTSEISLSLTTWFWLVWSAGVGTLLYRLLWQIRQSIRLRSRSSSASEAAQQQLQSLIVQLPLTQKPSVRFSTDIEGPCTAGLFRPVIYLPGDWYASLSETEQRVILIHELAHVAGRDVLWDLLARLSAIIYWFHPLVWRLPARHRLACEHLSDAQAASAIDNVSDYRRLLAQWALRRQGAESRLAALTMADRSQMLRRLKWLERPSVVDTPRLSRRVGFILLSLLCAVSLATVHFSPRVIAQETEPPLEAPRPEPEDKQGKANEKKPAGVPKITKPGKADINLNQTTPKTVTVVNDQGYPVAGATVRVGWWEDNEGDLAIVISPKPPVTNQQGEVTIQVPAGAARAQISAEAEGYAKAGTQYSLNGNPQLVLQQGRIIRVKALDTKGNLLRNAYPLLDHSRILGREFKQDKRRLGYFTSPVVKLDRRWLRVVDGNGEGPVLFSHLIDVTNPERVEEDGTIVAILEPGIRLEGRLDDSVPRPIKNGCVELYINEGQNHQIGGGWTWEQTADVKEDGTFVFDSLPTGGHAQLFALVDGFQSTRPSPQDLKNYLKLHNAGPESLLENAVHRRDAFWPHLFPLTPGPYKTEVELPCTPTTSLDVKVVDPIGQPIEGAMVKFNPNGYFLGGELFVPTTVSLEMSNQIIRHDNKKVQQRYQWGHDTFLGVKTDTEGIARVRNLPADVRESYKVTADGYQMPVYPTSSIEDPMRYALVDLQGGQTLRRTITMEKYVPSSSRKILVVDRQAEPVPDIKITVSEIAFEDAPDDWQLWASQRFGPLATGKSDRDGIVELQVPLEVNGEAVSRLRITIRGRIPQKGRDAYVQRKSLIIPRDADGRVVVLTVSDVEPMDKSEFIDVAVDYLPSSELLNNSPKALLKQLITKPSIVVLNRLLQLSQFKAATPLRFRGDWNLASGFDKKKSERKSVIFIPTDAGGRVVVLCDVRPQDASWDLKPRLRSPPMAAFVFSTNDGKLVRMIGGWASSKGSYCNLMLNNLGGTDDYFISTSAFETHGPFEYIQRWYQVGQEDKPAITFYGYANATAWSGKPGPSKPLAEFGYLDLRFNGKNLDHRTCGVLPNGTRAPRKLFWDGVRNQFIAPVRESVEGKPLYQVDLEHSHQFVPLQVEPGYLVVGGGRRAYENWHGWNCVVPDGKIARLHLFSVDASGGQPVETDYFTRELSAGQHNLHLHLTDNQQDQSQSDAEIQIDDTIKEKLTVPRVPIAGVPSVQGVPIARTGKGPLDLFNRATTQKQQRLIWRLELLDAGEAGE